MAPSRGIISCVYGFLLAGRILAQQARNFNYNEQFPILGLLGDHFGVPGIPATYDYVIVGGGTAGLTLARRLAADTSITVALIEAGGLYELDNGNFSQIPALASYFVGPPPPKNPLVDWYQNTEPQSGFGGRTIHYPSGKTLGGGSARNLLWYHRGSKGSYDKWADEVGDASYEFDQFLPFFEKGVQFQPPSANRPANATARFDSATLKTSGSPLKVGYPTWVNGISSWIARSLNSLKVRELPGLTSGDLLGWSYVTTTVDAETQTRSSSETSYLREALAESRNLQIYKTTVAKQVLFDSSKRATGVRVDSGGYEYEISAKQEVILSAGAFRSPQLLMVSGIGPRATLQQLSIPVLSDRPGVGQNMYDHVLFGTVYPVNLITHSQLTADPAFLAASVQEYNERRSGMLTNCGGDLLGFEKLPLNATTPSLRTALNSTFGPDWPDIELLFFDGDLLGPPPSPTANYVSSLAGLVAPFSRGNVTINSTNTLLNPVVSPNWLLDPRDQAVAVAGFKRARQIMQTDVISPVLAGEEAFPGANVTSDEDIMQVIRQSASSIDHAAGTCKMGRANDPNAVIDSKGRVFGVKGLRVVDASSFPFLPPGHPQSTVYALAEKIADDILNGRTPQTAIAV